MWKGINREVSAVIGSSSEGLNVAREIRHCIHSLFSEALSVTVWDEVTVFKAGEIYIESLERALREFDFAILVLMADDEVRIREQEFFQARDSVLFELGLFIGALGRKRTFIFRSNEPELRLPTDIDGILSFSFDKSKAKHKESGFRSECEKLGAVILDRAGAHASDRTQYFVLFPSHRNDPFYVHLLAGISSNPVINKDMTFVTPTHSYSGPRLIEIIDNLLRRQGEFAGGIIAPTLKDIAVEELTERVDRFEIPIVLVDINPYRDSKLPEGVTYVGFDNRAGGQKAAEAMAKALGPNLDGKRVLVIGNDDQRDRHEGFMESWNGPISPQLKKCPFNRAEARSIVNRVVTHLEKEFHGIFCASDEIALGATGATRAREHDTVVIGFDATLAATTAIDLKKSPLINTVVQDSYLLGEKAIRVLKKKMARETVRRQEEILSVSLHI